MTSYFRTRQVSEEMVQESYQSIKADIERLLRDELAKLQEVGKEEANSKPYGSNDTVEQAVSL